MQEKHQNVVFEKEYCIPDHLGLKDDPNAKIA